MGPKSPIISPPNLKSFCSNLPVLYAIAFGGVEIGKNNAVEAQSPMTTGRIIGLLYVSIIPIGIKIVAVAVLLIILDNITVKKAKKKTIA